MEGAWYLLYDDQKQNKHAGIKKKIRENIDNFHSKLVTESKITVLVDVFGPLGAGKSFFLNFLLNWGLPDEHKVENGPLPSASGGSQTPIPIYVKHGNNVQVLLHKSNKDESNKSPSVWFPKEELGRGTLARVRDELESKFEEIHSKFEKDKRLPDATCIEIQGPFPVFRDLNCNVHESDRTSSGHPQLGVALDVQFVDLPGRGDPIGDDTINVELNKADTVLFFSSSQSGRQVSSQDIADIFSRRNNWEFTSRPKLIHVVNDREPPHTPSPNFDLLHDEKKENLKKGWESFFKSSTGDNGVYKKVRENLPQLSAEVLLEKLSNESDVLYFHSGNPGFVKSLKELIDDHVQTVRMKEMIHPFLKKVHFVAKKLKQRTGDTRHRQKKKQEPITVNVGETPFIMLNDIDEAIELITSFIDETPLPLELDIKSLHHFLYNNFLVWNKTQVFLQDTLKASLENFTSQLIANSSTLQDVEAGLLELVEMLCKDKVQQYCVDTAPAYLLHVLGKRKNGNPFDKATKKRWSSASKEQKQDQYHELLYLLLMHTLDAFKTGTRDKQYKKSHFYLTEQLKEVVREGLAVRFVSEAFKAHCLKSLNEKLPKIIEFCHHSIREINPHPSLDVKKDLSLPEKMVATRENTQSELQCGHEEIIKEMTDLLNAPTKGKRLPKKADIIHLLETRLKFNHGDLRLRQSQSEEEQRLWAKALLNVLSNEDHFDVKLDPNLVLNQGELEVQKLFGLARKRLFAHRKSLVTSKINEDLSLPGNEIHLRKNAQEENCLEVLVSAEMSNKLHTIREEFKDPSNQIAPIFIPTIRPGPTTDMQGNYFLEEDPWSKNDRSEEEEVEGMDAEGNQDSGLNIFLVVEPQHLETFKTTIAGLQVPSASNINLMYIVLPQSGRGIGVTRAIIKSLAECLKFSLYWTIDDDIQFMYQFDANDRRWHKCSITRGLLFGQRVFQTCLEKNVNELSQKDKRKLVKDVRSIIPSWAEETQDRANELLVDQTSFAQVQKNPALLHLPFQNISEDCGGDAEREKELRASEQRFEDECRNRLFGGADKRIAGVSLPHVSSRRSDYVSKYPDADYMPSDQRYQIVLNNACALKGRNFVTDEMIFLDEEFQVYDKDKRNSPHWGIRGSDKSFSRALKVSGVIGYKVIRIVHDHKKLKNVFDRVGPSYIGPQSPRRSEDEDDENEEDA